MLSANMTNSTPSSISRHRPAILVVTGAAAAYGAWLLYSTFHAPAPSPELHRSNALRRANRRAHARSHTADIARSIQRLQQESVPLGEFDFFGDQVALNARIIITEDGLREIARARVPTATPEVVEDRIAQLYDTFYDRLLNYVFPDRALSVAETDAVTHLLAEQHMLDTPQNPQAFARAMQRHRNRFALADTEALLTADGADSVAATDLSWPSDENTQNEVDLDGITLQRTLYHIAEDRARHEGVIHRGITCNGCETKPIRGIRWRCANCSDYDLCSECEATNSHYKTHIFYKMRIPAPYMGLPKQEPIYPGRPEAMQQSLPTPIKKRLSAQIRMETEELEALWDQFTCLASTEWSADPNHVGWALDRDAFNHAFIPRYSTFTSAPNLVYDRIFCFFDTDHNSLIGFEEFIKGLDKLHSTDYAVKLRVAFDGYDLDGDGYISRKDVLRIFRAHYAIEREAARNYLAVTAEELSVRGALEVINSAQPLGSALRQYLPPEPDEAPRSKPDNASNLEPVLDDVPDTMDRASAVADSLLRDVSLNMNRTEILRQRWTERQFYTDEEEGFSRPEGSENMMPSDELEVQTDGEVNDRHRGSPSSSRVRFQDDVDVETRSNGSTSSRPIGERWGGYELPEPEKDLGKEIHYQMTQQAFNELMDPLFKEKEEAGLDAHATSYLRRTRSADIERVQKEFESETEKSLNRLVCSQGPYTHAMNILQTFCKTGFLQRFDTAALFTRNALAAEMGRWFEKTELEMFSMASRHSRVPDDYSASQMWAAKICRTQMFIELTEAVVALLRDRLDVDSKSSVRSTTSNPGPVSKTPMDDACRDPTMPQFRPNSLAHDTASADTPKIHGDINKQEENTLVDEEESFGPLFIMAGKVEEEPTPFPPDTRDEPPNTWHSTDTVAQISFNPQTSSFWYLYPLRNPQEDIICNSKYLQPLRTYVYYHPSSPLYLPFLASLKTMEAEIVERKGIGLVNFDEFRDALERPRSRFMEAWMDLVSF